MNQKLQPYRTKAPAEIAVSLEPCNENQEFNYCETFKGTPDAIIRRSLEIISGLKQTLRHGTFSVKIESYSLAARIYVDDENIYDENFDIISPIAKADQIFIA